MALGAATLGFVVVLEARLKLVGKRSEQNAGNHAAKVSRLATV